MNAKERVGVLRSFAISALASLFVASIFVLAFDTRARAEDDPAPATGSAPLSLDQVIDKLVRKNQERARNLVHTEATRVYHLAYRGFPGDKEAEMTVVASYDSPSTKEFTISSQSGSKVILDRVFKKLLESE